jgi:hypothetical protein
VKRGNRFVDEGNIPSSGGLTCGIDLTALGDCMAEATRNLHDNKEILGLRCELYGVLIAIACLGYQYLFTDFFGSYSLDKLADNQTTANADILRAINLLSLQVATKDADEANRRAVDVSDKTGADIVDVIKANKERRDVLAGQGSTFKSVLNWLTVIGALAVVLGKWLQLKHKESAATS